MMISRKKIQPNEIDCVLAETIARLRDARVSMRRIIRALKVSRQTIRKIDRGQHCSQLAGPRRRRCPGCGGKQLMPCRVCEARKLNPAAA